MQTYEEIARWLAEPAERRYFGKHERRYFGKHERKTPVMGPVGYQYCPVVCDGWSYPVVTEARVAEKPDFTRSPQVAYWINEKKTQKRRVNAFRSRALRSINMFSLPQTKGFRKGFFPDND